MRGLRRGCNMMLVIDSAKFTREHAVLRGSLPVTSFTRVMDSVASSSRDIQYHLQGGMDRLLRPMLTLTLRGELEVVCQRCLRPMPFVVEIDTVVTLFGSEEAIGAAEMDDPDVEGVLFAEKLDVAALIEDELILALPYAPTHQQCDADKVVKANKPNPFAVLAILKAKLTE